MPLKTDTIEEPVLNLTSMIDVVFLLIIFFMVGSEFTQQERSIEVNLPKADVSAKPLTELPDKLVISILENGDIHLKSGQVNLTELKDALIAAKQNFSEQSVEIRGAGEVPYERVIEVLEVCKEGAGVSSVSLAVRMANRGGELPE